MRQIKSISLLLILVTLLLTSCKASKDYVFTKDMDHGSRMTAMTPPEVIIKPGDRISIFVSNEIQELAAPFNSRAGYRPFEAGTSGSINPARVNMERGFLVDQNGYIEYPVLGFIKVSGLSISEISTMIKEKIIQGNYMRNPIVTTELLNFKVYVLGSNTMGGAMAYTAEDGQLTLLQLVSKLGDISSTARIDNVKVVREKNGKRYTYVVDLQSKKLYDSPAYYLEQNDEVYFEPRYRMREEFNVVFRYISVITALSSFATTIIYLTK